MQCLSQPVPWYIRHALQPTNKPNQASSQPNYMVYTTRATTNRCLLVPPKQATNQQAEPSKQSTQLPQLPLLFRCVYWVCIAGEVLRLPAPLPLFKPQCPPRRSTNQQAEPSNQSTQLLLLLLLLQYVSLSILGLHCGGGAAQVSNQPTSYLVCIAEEALPK